MDIIQRESGRLDGVEYAIQEMKDMLNKGMSVQDALGALEARVIEGRAAIHDWHVSRSEFL